MKDDILTRPLPAGPDRSIGSEETGVRPFEPAGIDWGSANRRRRSDPSLDRGTEGTDGLIDDTHPRKERYPWKCA